jgi:hypothetical protein
MLEHLKMNCTNLAWKYEQDPPISSVASHQSTLTKSLTGKKHNDSS